MSFGTYAELQAEVQSFLWDRTDVVSKVPTFIALAEAEMKRLLRTQQVVSQTPYSVSGEISFLPSGASEILSVQLDWPSPGQGTIDLDYQTPEMMDQWSLVSPSRPRFYTIVDERVYFLPVPDQEYTGHMRVRERFGSLSNSNRSNWILERHPDIYLCGALKWAKRWLIDSDQDWETPFYSAIEAANHDQPMRQRNTTLRNDELSMMSQGGRYDIRTDSYGGTN